MWERKATRMWVIREEARRGILLPHAALAALLIASWPGGVAGQIVGTSVGPEYQLSQEVRVDEVDAVIRARLAQIRSGLGSDRSAVVVDQLREVVSKVGDKLVNVTADLKGVPPRFVSVREYCQLLLTRLSAEALARYRQQIDPTCQAWLEVGLRARDAQPLQRLVDEELASSHADSALWYLGEWALQDGQPARARSLWRQLLPPEKNLGQFPTLRVVPDPEYPPAAVRARLVLCSILEGRLDRARQELKEFTALHPGTHGRFAGRDQEYVPTLERLIAEAEKWQRPPQLEGWRTFARSPCRVPVVAQRFEPIGVAWRVALPPLPKVYVTLWTETISPEWLREQKLPLPYHPVVDGDAVFVVEPQGILGFELASGRPLWDAPAGRVFSLEGLASPEILIPVNTIGSLGFTATIHRELLLARVGSPVTSVPKLVTETVPQKNWLVCLDCKQQGKLRWKLDPPGEDWAFEGPPCVEGSRLFALMRRSDVPSHLYLACFSVDQGNMLWRRFLCAADTPGRSLLYEMSHLICTVADGTVFAATNLGTVAAVSASTGQIRWITCYPRVARGDLSSWEPFRYREPNPCLYQDGILFVAPTDSEGVFALDEFTGTILWACQAPAERIRYLLGVVNGRLIATGDRVYWIDIAGERAGQVVAHWPVGPESAGYGRGLIAGNDLLFPTQDAIYIIDAITAEPLRVIPLSPWQMQGGNLIATEGYLLVASSRELTALRTAPWRVAGPDTKSDSR